MNTLNADADKMKPTAWPSQVYFILTSKAAERYCFYSLLPILPDFYGIVLGMSQEYACMMSRAFTGAVSFFPLVGAYLADTTWGKFSTIMSGSLVYVVGTILLAMSAKTAAFTLAVVSVIVCGLGAGGINATVTSFGADQFDMVTNKETQESYFAWNYSLQNMVATVGFAFSPYLRDYYGYFVAFVIPSAMMALSILVLYLGNQRNQGYTQNPLGKSLLKQILQPMWYLSITNRNNPKNVAEAIRIFGDLSVQCASAMYQILPVFSFLPIFWATNDLQYDMLTMQAEKMELNAYGMQKEFTGVFSGIFIVLFTILFDKLYGWLAKQGWNVSSIRKILVGFVFQLFAVGSLFFLEIMINRSTEKLSCFWQLIYTLNQAISESIVGVVVLEYAYEVAPPIMKSTLIAISFVFRFFSSLLAMGAFGAFSEFIPGNTKAQMAWFLGAMACNTFLYFICIDQREKRVNNESTPE